MTETWSLFAGNDLLVGIIGFVGVSSAVFVLMSATTKVDTRERSLRSRRTETTEIEE